MDDVYMGTILPWSVPWLPKGWAFCDGTILSTQEYTALYSLIGNQYGGHGPDNFALPDLRGRSPIGANSSSTDLKIKRGQTEGIYERYINLVKANLPPHTHGLTETSASVGDRPVSVTLYGSREDGEHNLPENGDYIGAGTDVRGRSSQMYRGTLDAPVPLSGVSGSIGEASSPISGTLHKAGGKQNLKLERTQPSLVINYIIALKGEYPPRP